MSCTCPNRFKCFLGGRYMPDCSCNMSDCVGCRPETAIYRLMKQGIPDWSSIETCPVHAPFIPKKTSTESCSCPDDYKGHVDQKCRSFQCITCRPMIAIETARFQQTSKADCHDFDEMAKCPVHADFVKTELNYRKRTPGWWDRI